MLTTRYYDQNSLKKRSLEILFKIFTAEQPVKAHKCNLVNIINVIVAIALDLLLCLTDL